jgi:hypothetical protein
MGPWFVRPAILAAAALALISPRALCAPALWITVALLTTVRIAADWPLADNHIYLLAYWCLAIGLAFREADVRSVLARSSRWLLGLAFAFAVLWKAVLSPDFLDGRFFRITLLTDPRFVDAAVLIGGLTPDQLDQDRRALAPLPDGAELLNPPELIEPARLRAFARLSTYGILVLETALSVVMLLPSTRRVGAARHAVLLGFCLVTYAFAPVAGFGWLLLVMGLTQTDPDAIWLRRGYVALFLLVIFYSEVPWTGLLRDFLS